MADILLPNFLIELDQLQETFQAGASGIEQAELRELISRFNDKMDQTVKHDLISAKPDIVHNWNSIIEAILINQLASALIAVLEVDKFYSFGNYLHQCLNPKDAAQTKLMHEYLDLIRFTNFLQRLDDPKKFEILIHKMIEKSNFNTSFLVRQRIRDYPNKTIFKVIKSENEQAYTWKQVTTHVDRFARGIGKIAMVEKETPSKVAFLMENSLNMVFLDLACLTSGIVNVMIPANSVQEHVEYILNQTQAAVIIVSNDKQLLKVKSIKKNLPHLKYAVLLTGSSIENWVITIDEMVQDGLQFPEDQIKFWKNNIQINDLATIMYTSGTTGDPKGIMFSHMNIVYKRFCRAMALPKIGENDRYLSFLPLYHTFGRWLEMMGAIFWGAEYNFMENPALPTMLDNMKRIKPTIFISIPKKWYELYEHVKSEVDIELDAEEQILHAVKNAAGGELRWGLSAAGYLEPDVFKFFQQNGIELMSGFGMTEATGGITMTPPGKYIENSLGRALPGIELKLAEDGELMIRGQYVMIGYYGLREDQNPFIDGWLPTGDIMQLDQNGFYEIIDRKKEIYKNIKGETIAPQKIENLFRDFNSIHQVFLVGDHRPFNTVLIKPTEESENNLLSKMSEEERDSYFASVVVTVNKFLASFERIVDFRLIDRPFQAEKGELTPKSTYKRKVIEKNFVAIIDSMYTKNYISLSKDDTEIRIPTWFLRERGCLTSDVKMNKEGLAIDKYGYHLTIKKMNKSKKFLIGNFYYEINQSYIDLQQILANPIYWLGNQALLDFTGDTIFQWYRLDEIDKHISFAGLKSHFAVPPDIYKNFQIAVVEKEHSLFRLHQALRHIQSPDLEQAQLGIEYLKLVIEDQDLPYFHILHELVKRYMLAKELVIQQELFKLGIKLYKGTLFADFLGHYVRSVPNFLNDNLTHDIVKETRGEDYLYGIHAVIKSELKIEDTAVTLDNTPIKALFNLLAEFGIQHPTKYKRARQLLVRYVIQTDNNELSATASEERSHLKAGFRKWLGDNRDVAVDAETGIEYYWEDVVTFEEGITEDDRKKVLNAIKNTAMVREAIFLFSEGRIIRLYDIPPGGVWISFLDDQEYKKIFRISVQTRHYGSYDISLNLLKSKISPEIQSEINWMIHASAPRRGLKLVEDYGGHWEEFGFWTEEYASGETVSKFLQRSLRRDKEDAQTRLYHIWPFFIWTAMVGHLNFWKRSGYEVELVDKSANNMIIPRHDYQTGQRFLSIAERKKSNGLYSLMRDFYDQFIIQTQDQYSFLSREFICRFIFYGVLNSEGEQRGLELLTASLQEIEEKKESCDEDNLANLLKTFLEEIKREGYSPKNLFFAIQRFHRWNDLTKDAELSAQARTINELSDTYHLHELEDSFPGTRTRFFLESVFADSDTELRKALLEVVLKQYRDKISYDETLKFLSTMQEEFELSEKEQYFLSRLSYPHLKPTDSATLVTAPSDGTTFADVVVQLEDYDGIPYWVRKPVSPKEISKLHQLFLDSNLPVFFKPEHRFMVAVSERGHVIGGLFYSYIDDKTVYMEKIVVSGHFRRKGISEGVMHEFFNRMRGERIQSVTTGFFRPEYFYRFGFKVERKYAGLVKDLGVQDHDVKEKLSSNVD